jgi:GcrA cell cycle regulator
MRGMQWEEAQVEALKEHWAAGRSGSEIAALLNGRFGADLTRNAVIGKLGRLGLLKQLSRDQVDKRRSAHAKRIVAASPAAQRPVKPNRHTLLFARPFAPAPAPERPPTPPASGPAPDAAPITIMQLDRHRCKWPEERDEYGEQLYCGAPVGETDRRRRYCDHHHSRECGRG